MYLEKTKRVHLSGTKLRQLNDAVHRRDGGRCIVYGEYVEPGVKFHHEPCGVYKSDEISKAVLLCNRCHYARHHTRAAEIREQCVAYLQRLYGSLGARKE